MLTVNRLAGENFARAHFHLIAEPETSPRSEGDMELGLRYAAEEINLTWHPYSIFRRPSDSSIACVIFSELL